MTNASFRALEQALRRWAMSPWPNDVGKWWGLVQTGGSTSRGSFGPMLPCAASGVGGGGSGGAACNRRPQRHVPASGQSSQGCNLVVEFCDRPASNSVDGFCDTHAKADARLAPVSTSEMAGPRPVMPRKNEAPQVQAGAKGSACTFAADPNQRPRPSRGENRIALGQFRSQRHLLLQSSGTLRLRDSLGNRKPRTVMLHLGDAHGIASTSGLR
jgi:hypothetical protein